jgi:N-acetylglucosaminyl-diphospho-decaprenol L-rhamnosyltransferase
MLVRVDAFRTFGGFDENFFLYYEDDDICLKALHAGFDCLIEPAAQVFHRGGASSKPSVRTELLKSYHWARSKHLIIKKYQGMHLSMLYRFKIAVSAPLAIVVYALLLNKKYFLKWLGWGYFSWKVY